MCKNYHRFIEGAFLGNAFMLIIAIVVAVGSMLNLIGYALGKPLEYVSWKYGTLSGMNALAFEIGGVLLSVVLAVLGIRGLWLWRKKHT